MMLFALFFGVKYFEFPPPGCVAYLLANVWVTTRRDIEMYARAPPTLRLPICVKVTERENRRNSAVGCVLGIGLLLVFSRDSNVSFRSTINSSRGWITCSVAFLVLSLV